MKRNTGDTRSKDAVLKVRDVMQTKFVAFDVNMDIDEAIRQGSRRRLMGAPVVCEGNLVGVFSEKDSFRLLANWAFQTSNDVGGTVGDHMTTKPLSVSPDADMSMVASQFLSSHFRGFPVVEAGKLVGLLSRRDIIAYWVNERSRLEYAHYPDVKYGRDIVSLQS